MIRFTLHHKDKRARRGTIETPHGNIETPVFMPVGTDGSVKALTSDQVLQTRSQIILCNTYHLYLRPGLDVLKVYKGVHSFMNWQKPILTDSGGYQVFSLANGNVKISEKGVLFKSHIDGSSHHFTPEKSIQIQTVIGSDIMMAFDHLTLDNASFEETKYATDQTHRWLVRSIAGWREYDPEEKQSLFGIIQGGRYEALRVESAKFVVSQNLSGIAIGGESIGYNKEATREILEQIMPFIPESIPRYTMGVGDIDDIFAVVARGVDMFDCVSPTRLARNGALLVSPLEGGAKENHYRLNITKSMYANQMIPVDKTCNCYTCCNYTRGYLHHLFHAKELLSYTLASIHNVHMLANICEKIRTAIETDQFDQLYAFWVKE